MALMQAHQSNIDKIALITGRSTNNQRNKHIGTEQSATMILSEEHISFIEKCTHILYV